MKKLTSLLLCLTVATSAFVLSGCIESDTIDDTIMNTEIVVETEIIVGDGDGELPDFGDTEGARLCTEFVAAIEDGKDMRQAVNIISSEDVCGYNCMSMDVSEGFLNGFTDSVNGFSDGVMFSPVIGSIPFVGYVFVSDDPDALLDNLMSSADPRWNICTEADEIFGATYNEYVFFIMLPTP